MSVFLISKLIFHRIPLHKINYLANRSGSMPMYVWPLLRIALSYGLNRDSSLIWRTLRSAVNQLHSTCKFHTTIAHCNLSHWFGFHCWSSEYNWSYIPHNWQFWEKTMTHILACVKAEGKALNCKVSHVNENWFLYLYLYLLIVYE